MPTRTKAEKSGQQRGFPETRWVECELSEEDKTFLKGEEVTAGELLESVASVVDAGYKLSVSFDSRSDAVGAYLTAPKEASGSVTTCLSARAPSLERALAVLMYKHFTKLKEEWGGKAEEKKARSQWA